MKTFGTACLLLGMTALLQAASIGKPAPLFSLANSQKQVRTLAKYRGKVVFVNFWASWCAPCQEELPALNRLAADYKGKKVRVLAINVDHDRKAAKKLLSKLLLNNPQAEVLWDSKSNVVSSYNVETMPSSFVLDPAGVIRFAHAGFHLQDPETWRKEIDGLLP